MHEQVKDYYGKTLQSSDDLQSNACCTDTNMPAHLKAILAKIHPQVSSRYYGCGLIAPEALEGMHILDLGSGSGRDCYVLSALVGPKGSVTGVDMTPEQLSVAREYIDYHRQQFGFDQSNVAFFEGYIEKLDALPLGENQFDIIISNCVINLSPDKEAVLKQAHRLLKSGGEMYFSDVYSDRRVPTHLTNDAQLHGECLSGALYWNDFINLAKGCGFADPRLVEDRPLTIDNPEIESKLQGIRFFSATYRLFKINDLEPACEDYGQSVIYNGGLPYSKDAFLLDKHHIIKTGEVFPVCGNTYRMLSETRFKPFFQFNGNTVEHYGLFEGCGSALPFDTGSTGAETSTNSCC
ncbi:methyltransferase domain-containing protein [Ketobacter sp. MCCC 1A13808]|uniref:methyltransferase domain-containing protein n=1 Tax=Ketobacter sp. MCCC 1A13808 TaxID=2602738 RepID=UPI0012EC8790|nr:methyltransferase domain-containing protein [Ketobacter sp. MCCC 1A13808]MVF12418.1 methyltransferase domain-containing protein [Ketobacter sp. MCCC 1A13808]